MYLLATLFSDVLHAGEAKSLKKPPPGVDDITAVVIILLEGNPKDKSWGAACKVSDEFQTY